jgi:hypothetical protein
MQFDMSLDKFDSHMASFSFGFVCGAIVFLLKFV